MITPKPKFPPMFLSVIWWMALGLVKAKSEQDSCIPKEAIRESAICVVSRSNGRNLKSLYLEMNLGLGFHNTRFICFALCRNSLTKNV